jgi:hypothetical protein
VWKLLAIAALSFAGVPALLGYLVQAARWHYAAHVTSLYFKCFKCFVWMLQVFHLDVTSKSWYWTCCNGYMYMFQVCSKCF